MIALSGRLHNRTELARILALERATTDADIILSAYERWGVDFGRELVGAYAVAILDSVRERLVVCRDRLGMEPAFFSTASGTFWASSSLELLTAVLPAVPHLDTDATADFFARGGVLKPGRTLLAGVFSLRPAHVTVASRAGVETHRYWWPREASLPWATAETYDEQFSHLLDEAVLATAETRRPLAIDISGGLDSSTVATTAVRLFRSGTLATPRVVGCSLVASRTTSANEVALQVELVESLGIERVTFDVDEDLPFSSDVPQPWYQPAPEFCWPLAVRRQRTFAAKLGVRLSGLGGDPVFCGRFPPAYLADLLRQWKVRHWAREVSAWSRNGRYSVNSLLRDWSVGTLDQQAGRPKEAAPEWMMPRFRAKVSKTDPNEPEEGRIFNSLARELQFRTVCVDADIASAGRCDRDERYPLLYWPLVEFMLALPWEHKLSATDHRIIQRRALRNHLPESILRRRTKANGSAVAHWGLARNWESLQPLLAVPCLEGLGFIDSVAFSKACTRLRSGLSGSQWRYFIAAISLERWLQRLSRSGRPALADGLRRLRERG